uniref:Uncharacterized protein n=1 Tax=Candidatus Methanomethylicus mesodigestus TaxID=1867258 RepID=A0A7C3IT75_9CREN
MPDLLGKSVAMRSLIIRTALSSAIAAAIFATLCAVPALLPSLASGAAPSELQPAMVELCKAAVPTYLPALGAVVAASAFIASFVRGSKAYGPATLLLGALSLAYVLAAFHLGSITIEVPLDALRALIQPIVVSSANLAVTIDWHLLMAICSLPPSLTIVKGLYLTLTDFRSQRSRAAPPA